MTSVRPGIGPATLWSPALTSAVPGSVATLPGQLVPVIHFTLNLKYPRRIKRREKLFKIKRLRLKSTRAKYQACMIQ